MADTLEIYGIEFPNSTGIKATDNNGVVQTYIRPQGTKSITENGTGIDVANYASDSYGFAANIEYTYHVIYSS